MPQEITLENKSIRDNIVMDLEHITPLDIEDAASAAQIHHEIEQLPMGYQTLISEMGANFSGRQRIALARAIAKKPRVLILDDATSSLDLLNEQRIADFLAQQQCTRIVIAHRVATIMDADEILVMHDGRIVERGTHHELHGQDGYYRELFHGQLTTVP